MTLAIRDVLAATEGKNSLSNTINTLLLKGDASDSATLTGAGTWSTSTTSVVDSETYDVYTNDGVDNATLLVDADILVTIV